MADSKFRKKDNYEPLANEDPVSGKVFFDQVLDRFHIDLSDPCNQVLIQWRNIVGDAIADHVKCDSIKDGIIYVSCDHPSRAAYIRLNSKEIIKKITGIFPELDLKKIITRVRS